MKHHPDYLARKECVNHWYAPARIGLFYHWGLFTGGGMTTADGHFVPLRYKTVEEFEAAAPSPEAIAKNLFATARRFGAKYVNFTCLHAADGYAVMFPTKQPEFTLKTSKDYLGAVIEESARTGIRLIIYIPMCSAHVNAPEGPYMRGISNQREARGLYGRLVEEIGERYDKPKIGGFWLDGGFTEPFLDFPAFIKNVFPEAIVNVNSCTFLEVKEDDFSVTEFLDSAPVPPYNRPSALTKVNSYCIGAPPDDFNEDIPNCASWWYWEDRGPFRKEIGAKEKPYLDNPNFLLKQMISSLGQRGQWNFTFGIPVRLDGTLEEKYHPMFDKVERFMRWGSEAIYNTTGGKTSPIRPGFFHGGGFCSVTFPRENPKICYVLITEPPDAAKSGYFLVPPGPDPYAAFFTNGLEPIRVSDLRTGAAIDFDMPGGMGFHVRDMDWNDISEHGVKVLKVEF